MVADSICVVFIRCVSMDFLGKNRLYCVYTANLLPDF